MKDIDFVRENYGPVARGYMDQKDPAQASIPIFKNWLSKVSSVLELGCASGFPIAEAILTQGLVYTGIDLNPQQIRLAKERYPQWQDHFREFEMVEYLRAQADRSVDGIVSMFSIRHLPRIYHVELFSEIFRVLTPGGYLLVDHPTYSEDGRGTWFEANPMYWSSFSKDWQQLTLKELGYLFIEEYTDVKVFQGKEEETLFCIYRKPLG
ncbi:MAG: class I SAM-dependent methyltransferase [Candidatus Kariarchaeaceae archaeon]